ncbi:MAG: hypothetical protein FJ315_03070 [SAR202 cluster bacterium]|nr:hypothetical protein [SAR202 cluster bacterium]
MGSIKINVPPFAKVTSKSVKVSVSPRGCSWAGTQLGNYAKKQGVYIFHQNGKPLYVGKTNGRSMSFGMRLRRHLQESAAGSKHTYPKLAALSQPFFASFIPTEVVRRRVQCQDYKLSDQSKVNIFEQALQGAYKPSFQDGT